MKNKRYLSELKEIQELSNSLKQRCTINENTIFEDDFDNFDTTEFEEPSKEETDVTMKPEEEGMKQLDKMGEVDQIRRITLDGMRKLADNPEHPQFQALLKIFQICNKSIDVNNTEEPQKQL